MWTLYGLKNCDTCRKAMKWMAQQGIEAALVDVRRDGVSPDRLAAWGGTVGWDVLVNKRGTTWRALSDGEKAQGDGETAKALIIAHPAVMKRPVFEKGATVLVGFSESQKTAILEEK